MLTVAGAIPALFLHCSSTFPALLDTRPGPDTTRGVNERGTTGDVPAQGANTNSSDGNGPTVSVPPELYNNQYAVLFDGEEYGQAGGFGISS